MARINEPTQNQDIYRFVADYVRNGGSIDFDLRKLSWNRQDMDMSIIPDLPPSNPDIPSVFVIVLGQCVQPPLREPPVFEVIEASPGSGQWETEGGYPLSTYTMKVD